MNSVSSLTEVKLSIVYLNCIFGKCKQECKKVYIWKVYMQETCSGPLHRD